MATTDKLIPLIDINDNRLGFVRTTVIDPGDNPAYPTGRTLDRDDMQEWAQDTTLGVLGTPVRIYWIFDDADCTDADSDKWHWDEAIDRVRIIADDA